MWTIYYKEKHDIATPPINGFDDMILLTNEGKLWKFPVDNEQGYYNINLFSNFMYIF